MTTQEFLSANRNLVIKVYNANAKEKTSLKEFMTYLLNNYEGDFTEKSLISNMFKAVENAGVEIETVIEVKYTKPYSESNHAKAVAYHGKEKVQLMSNAK